MFGKQRYYSLTLDNGTILLFQTEQERDGWDGGEADMVKRNYEVQDDRKQRKDLDDWYKDRFGK